MIPRDYSARFNELTSSEVVVLNNLVEGLGSSFSHSLDIVLLRMVRRFSIDINVERDLVHLEELVQLLNPITHLSSRRIHEVSHKPIRRKLPSKHIINNPHNPTPALPTTIPIVSTMRGPSFIRPPHRILSTCQAHDHNRHELVKCIDNPGISSALYIIRFGTNSSWFLEKLVEACYNCSTLVLIPVNLLVKSSRVRHEICTVIVEQRCSRT